MHLSTKLDCDLVALESADELTLLIDLTAPAAPTSAPRAAATLQVVLDHSGSMAGERLEGAKAALLALVDRLDPTDNLGVVAFDDNVQAVVPAGPLTDKQRVRAAITSINDGGSTDLSGGYLRGLQEARRVAGPAGATVLIISDGHANAGITDPVQLGKVAVEAQTHRITTTTLGFGLGYDERLLAALAQGGAGNELFAEEADTATALISGEVDGLLEQVAQAASLRVRWTPVVAGAHILNELPFASLPDGFVVELGSFYSGEERKLLITLQIPGIPALGLAEVATLELTHVSLPDLVQHTTAVPVHVNVVPGDQAAGRIRDPQVRSEALFQQTQRAKRQASRMLSQGQAGEASRFLSQASLDLTAGMVGLEGPMSDELTREARLLEALSEEAVVDSSRAAKASSHDASTKSRTRGRRRGGALIFRCGSDELTVEEWEVVRLLRLVDTVLAPAFRPAAGLVQGEDVAIQVAAQLGVDHSQYAFFVRAAGRGGFTVERA
jgi:Ca-activated chloride channel family protein